MPVIDAQRLSKRFLLHHNRSIELKVRVLNLLHPSRRESVEEFWALKDVSLRIERGEAVGLVGRNGSGKSTLLKLIAAIHRPTSGHLFVSRSARIGSMIELGVGFHPELTGRENVFLNASIHGLTRAQIEEIYPTIVEYSGLRHFMDVPIKSYSSGMHMRLGFSIVANLNPDILLLDEIFAVGDAEFQQQCVATVQQFLDEGKTLIFVSHSPDAIRTICRRVCVLDQGRLVFDGGVDEGLAFYERSQAPPAEAHVAPVSAEAGASDGVHAAPDELGVWTAGLLHRQGLKPTDRLLDVRHRRHVAAPVADFLGPDSYWVIDHVRGPEAIPPALDCAVAVSVFAHLPFNSLAVWIACVVGNMKPGGRFFVTWFENPDAANVEPIEQASGITTYAAREPFHYNVELIRQACEAVGARLDRVDDRTHPTGESVFVITRRP